MSMRISSVALPLALALTACAPESGVPEGESVECALGEGAGFASDCILERTGGNAFAIHHPDGAFRRFTFDPASGVLTISDGAEGVTVQPAEGEDAAQFAVGPDRYRIRLDLLSSADQ